MTDELWEAAIKACYGDTKPMLTKAERGKMNAALKQLREVGATPEDLMARARQYPRVMPPGCLLTIMGLVANWNRCKPPEKRTTSSHAMHTEWQRPLWMK